jgi:hypothetical protein
MRFHGFLKGLGRANGAGKVCCEILAGGTKGEEPKAVSVVA